MAQTRGQAGATDNKDLRDQLRDFASPDNEWDMI